MTEFEAIPWQPEMWEAEAELRRGGRVGGRAGGGGGRRADGGRDRSGRPRSRAARFPSRSPRWSGLASGGSARRGGPGSAIASDRRRRWPHRRPWILGPWAGPWLAAPWMMPPDAADAPPEEPAPLPPEAGAEPASPEADPASELEMWRRTVQPLAGQTTLSIDWSQRITIAGPRRTLPGIAGGGIYLVVDREDAPIYVGETGSFQGRWAGRGGRLIALFNLGLPQPCCPIHVYFGRVAADDRSRKAVEHTVIRTLINGGLGQRLSNIQPRDEFRVVGAVRFENVLPPPLAGGVRFSDARKAKYYVNNAIDIPDAETYEIAVGR